VAAVDIPPFAVLGSDMVKTCNYPKGDAPAAAFNTVQDVLERSVITPLVPGEILLEPKLAPKGTGRGLAAKIPPGMRAFTIHTPTVEAGVAGFILPGNRVDVLLTIEGRMDKDLSGGSTTTLLQNVEVLAIEQRVAAPVESKFDPNQLKSVTLLVPPRDAAKLNLAQSTGKLHLSLRNLNDTEPVLTQPIFASEFWGKKFPEIKAPLTLPKSPVAPTAPAVAPPPPLPPRTPRGMRGGGVQAQPPGPMPAGP